MAKKQTIILTHGSNKPTNVTGLTKGEVLVQHASNAEDLALWTLLDDGQTLEAISSKAYVDKEIESAKNAATTKIAKGDNSFENLTITETTNDDSSKTYTIGLTDVAKDSDLQALDGRVKTIEETTIPALEDAISAETEARESAVAELNASISAETTAREIAIAEINKTIEENELTTAEALNDLNSRIDSLNDTFATDEELADEVQKLEEKIRNSQGAATTKIEKGEDSNNNLTITSTTNADSSTTYTIGLTDVAKDSDLQALDGRVKTIEETTIPELDARVTVNEGAISALQQDLSDETSAREEADEALSERIDAIDTAIAGGVHFIGVFEEKPDTANNGDIVIVGSKEFIYSLPEVAEGEEQPEGSWIELGDTTAETERISTLEGKVETIEETTIPALSESIDSIEDRVDGLESDAVYTITIDNTDTNKITATKTNNAYALNFDNMIIDGGEY